MQRFICPYCYRFFENPVLLDCKHPVCSKCAQTQFSFELLRYPRNFFPAITMHNLEKKVDHDEKQLVGISCPVCNEKTSLIVTQGITKLEKDTQLEEKVKKAWELKVKNLRNEECRNQATWHCEDCEHDFCQACFEKLHFDVAKGWENHKTTVIDNQLQASPCSKQGHLPNQVACLDNFEKVEHGSSFVNQDTEKMKEQMNEQLVEINKQIKQIKETLSSMDNLKGQIAKSHTQFTVNVKENFSRIIKQLEQKRDGLVTESEKIEYTTLSNISLQQEALTNLLRQKTEIVEQVKIWIDENDSQMDQCKQLLQRNQEMNAAMFICCENGELSTSIDISPIEQSIDKLAYIYKDVLDLKLPTVKGLKEGQKDEKSVTVQWDSVQYNFAVIYYVIHMKADSDDSTSKIFKIPAAETRLQLPVAANWKQLICTIHCAIDEQLIGPKSSPISIDLLGKPQDILQPLRQGCYRVIYERMQSVFNQKGIQLSLTSCKLDDSSAIAIAKIIPALTQLQQLYLSYNQIGDSGAIAIANSIDKLTDLQLLYLSKNQIGDSGAIAIANSISNFTQLQQLGLSQNQIGDSGATAIVNTVSKLTQMQELYLQNNNISKTVKQQIKQTATLKYLSI